MRGIRRNVTWRSAALCALLLALGAAAAFAEAELEMEKFVTTASGSCISAGDTLSVDARTTVLFCYTIRNTGSETAANLQLIEDNGTPDDPSDDFSVPLGITDLPAQFTLKVQHDLDVNNPGVFRYIATISGNDATPTGAIVRAKDNVLVRVAPVNALLEITKNVTTVGGSCFAAGDSITVDARTPVLFCYNIHNAGKATATGLELAEDNGTPSDPSDDYTVSLGAHTSIEPGVQLNVQHQYPVDVVGTVTHTASVSGANQGTSGGTRQASDGAVVVGEHVDAVIELTKTVTTTAGSCLSAGSTLSAEAGSEIQFCYTIRNVGKAALLNLTLTEDGGTPNDPSDDLEVPLGANGSLLLPQAAVTISGIRTTPVPPSLGPVSYTATVEGTNDGTHGGTVTGTDAVTVAWRDTAPPAITECVDNIHVGNSWGIMGARLTLPSPTVTDSSGMLPAVHVDPASGSIFPVGTTLVQAVATDAGGNTATCMFAVTVDYVTPPRIQISLPTDRERVMLHEPAVPLFRVDSAAAIDRIETTELPGGGLDTTSPGYHTFEVTAVDAKGLSSTASVRYCVAYRIGPSAPVCEWAEDWLFIEDELPVGSRIPLGATTLSGRYPVGDAIEVFFTLRDAQGAPQRSGIGQLSVVQVVDLNDAAPGEIVAFYAMAYDKAREGYTLAIPTTGWVPGIYDLWLGLDDETTRRVRVEILDR